MNEFLVGLSLLCISGIGAYLVYELSKLRETVSNKFDELRKDVQDLNKNVALIVQRVDTHETRIGSLEKKKK